MEITTAQIKRTEAMMKEFAKGEAVTVDFSCPGILYVFGSELATLRIFAKYNSNGAHFNSKVRTGYSVNLKSFYISLDLGA